MAFREAAELVKLDLGCGPRPMEGFIGVDVIPFPGVSVVVDLREDWPWADASVAEVHCSHCIEHFDAIERCHIVNELYRVLVPGGKATIIAPHWGSSRAYGDPTHKWSPVSEFWFYYLSKAWRAENAPHTDAEHWDKGFNCDFEATWGYGLSPAITSRNAEFQQFAINHYREAVFDIHACLTKRTV